MTDFELYPFFTAGAVVDDILYFSDNCINALFSVDLNSGIIQYINAFPDEKINIFLQHRQAIIYKGTIIFVPDQGQAVHIFNSSTKEIRAIKIEKKDKSEHSMFAFCDSVLRDDKLWILPGNAAQDILVIDLSDYHICNYDLKLSEELLTLNAEMLFWKLCLHDDCAYMAVRGMNQIVKYDFSNHVTEVMDTGITKLDAVHKANGQIWLSTETGRLFLWKPEKNEATEYVVDDQFSTPNLSYYPYTVFDYQDITWAVPGIGGNVYKADHQKQSFELENKDLKLPKTARIRRGNLYDKYSLTSMGLLFFPLYNTKLTLFSKEGTKKIPYRDKEQYIRMRKEAASIMMKEELVVERESLPLLLYMNAVKKQDK